MALPGAAPTHPFSAAGQPDSQGATSATGFRHREPGECLSPTFSCWITHFSPVTQYRFSRSSIGMQVRNSDFSFTESLSERLSQPLFILCPAAGSLSSSYAAAPSAPQRAPHVAAPTHPFLAAGQPDSQGATSATGFRHREPGECLSPTFFCWITHFSPVTQYRPQRPRPSKCPYCRSYGSFRISNKVRFDHTNVTAGSPISAMPSVPEVLRNLMCLSFVPEDICAWGFLVSSGYKSCPPASKATRQNRRITKCSSNAPFHGDRGIECGPALVAYGYQMIPERTPVALPRHPWAIPKSDPIQLWLLLPATCRTP